ncbi:MAG: hypothetical protein DWQ04_00335 [Chloroflexi bacterium]|nr:MAG: hypothetical protein DWQ04_00335 [Chloroflexota bacterium]
MPTTDNNPEQVIVLLQSDCEIEVISRKRVSAKELASIKGKRRSLCDCPTQDDPDVVFAEKDDLRNFVINLAKLLLDRGVDEFDCTRVSTLDAACCREWNNLLDAVASGGNTFDAGNRVLAACLGIG